MTQEQVIQKRAELDALMHKLKLQMEHLKLEMKYLSLECKHPNAFKTYDYGGGTDRYCPDCKAL